MKKDQLEFILNGDLEKVKVCVEKHLIPVIMERILFPNDEQAFIETYPERVKEHQREDFNRWFWRLKF